MPSRGPVQRIAKWACSVLTLLLLMVVVATIWYWADGDVSPGVHVYVSRGGFVVMVTTSTGPLSHEPWVLHQILGNKGVRFDWCWWFEQREYGYTWDLISTAITTTIIPLWAPLVLTTVPAGILWRPDWKTARDKRLGLCPSCGYDRRGLADDAACPECGSAKSF